MPFPHERPRRLRSRHEIRKMVREIELTPGRLILPLFVTEGKSGPVRSMPGVRQHTVTEVVKEAREVFRLGIPAVILFGIPKKKDERASGAYAKDGIVQRAVRAIKSKVPRLMVITDVCLCEYMSHGHCGIVEKNKINNDKSLKLLAQTALSHAIAGADMVAPSDMMDGRVAAIRQKLDQAGFSETPILSYAVKQASSFYGPFREAAGSAPKFGDRKTYQMDSANSREAIREAELDVKEGADIIMVKPALPSLDLIRAVRAAVKLPVAAYQVSGEYAMIKAASAKGWLDEKAIMMESLVAIRRAGADLIITYFAKEAAKLL
ncbi:MAG: porphobilinogen synthase [Deltaproteobacteria bacterium]|nr:porphobilinogen synthase [Deltaproteobacteria bacterium]